MFACSYKDMRGIDWDIAEHKIALYVVPKPVKQRLHRMKLEWALKIKEEVQK